VQDPEFLTVDEVAEWFRISRWSITRLIESGELEAVRVGKRIRVVVSSCNDYLQKHTVQPVTTKE